MEWTVFETIAAIVSLCAVFVGAAIKLISRIDRIEGTVGGKMDKIETLMGIMADNFKELGDRNAKSHERIFAELEEHDKRLDNHELRLVQLENNKK